MHCAMIPSPTESEPTRASDAVRVKLLRSPGCGRRRRRGLRRRGGRRDEFGPLDDNEIRERRRAQATRSADGLLLDRKGSADRSELDNPTASPMRPTAARTARRPAQRWTWGSRTRSRSSPGSKGIGLAVARALADEGACRRQRATATGRSRRCHRGVRDLSGADGPGELVQRRSTIRRLDILVNNVGGEVAARRLLALTGDDFAAMRWFFGRCAARPR